VTVSWTCAGIVSSVTHCRGQRMSCHIDQSSIRAAQWPW